jgi:cobalamin biosynthesis protein CbiG
MKFDFEKGKERLLEWMDMEFDCSYAYSLEYIKEQSSIEDVRIEVESWFRFEEMWIGKTAAVRRATVMREIFEALEDTAIENDDNFIIEMFITEE